MFIVLLFGFGTAQPTSADDPLPLMVPIKPVSVQELVSKYSAIYHVSRQDMLDTTNCENKEHDPKARSKSRYTFNDPKRGIIKGEQEQSYGLAMIHLPDHPDITLSEAEDPDFSIEFMAKNFAKGNQHLWTCWKLNHEVKFNKPL